MWSTRYSCQILMKRDFSGQIFDKSSDIRFHENQSSGSRVVSCGQTDGRSDMHDETNSRPTQFCERALKSVRRGTQKFMASFMWNSKECAK